MAEKKTSIFANGLIWFGAAVSIAEILTGTLIAPLGITKGLAAVIAGHLIGCALLFFVGLIGGKTEKSAMETVKMSFGQKGALLFSSLNVLQLIGWTAVMIVSGASAASAVANLGGGWVWCLVIGALIVIWILIGIKNLGKLNIAAMGALFVLTIIMSTVIFKGNATFDGTGTISFGAAVELSAAMPLSWLPLISDYTRTSAKPTGAAAASAAVYFIVSSWMYMIGLGAALYTGQSDIAATMVKAGLGSIALIIIIFSTVTTTFLDAYSGGVSAVSISSKIKEKPAAIAVCALGVLFAVFTPITQFEDFLYLIGSVFAPMTAIQLVDFFILKKDVSNRSVDWTNLLLWAAGFGLYRIFLRIDTPVGNTFPVMVITAAACAAISAMKGRSSNAG